MPRHPSGSLIPQACYLHPVAEVAVELLGRHLVRGEVTVRITEVEAYGGSEDSASHGRFGRTPRNAPMWGPGGHAYLYLCYGMHWMLNIVAGPPDHCAAVLVRAAEVVAGLDTVLARRRAGRLAPGLLAGPGKVAQALGLSGDANHHPLFRNGGLELREGDPPGSILRGPRVGIDFAAEPDRERPWRFALAGCRAVSRPKLPAH